MGVNCSRSDPDITHRGHYLDPYMYKCPLASLQIWTPPYVTASILPTESEYNTVTLLKEALPPVLDERFRHLPICIQQLIWKLNALLLGNLSLDN